MEIVGQVWRQIVILLFFGGERDIQRDYVAQQSTEFLRPGPLCATFTLRCVLQSIQGPHGKILKTFHFPNSLVACSCQNVRGAGHKSMSQQVPSTIQRTPAHVRLTWPK